MSKKNAAEIETGVAETEPIVADSVALEPVLLTVKAEHVATPHGVELKRKDGKVVDARTQNFACVEAIGAKTIENIIRECGTELPSGDAELTISFSPHTGEVVAAS